MDAEGIARKLADVFRHAGSNYPAEPEVILGGLYPLVLVWDDARESTLVIACTDNRHDSNAKRFADMRASFYARVEENECLVYLGYVAHPAATDPTAIMIEELIWNGTRGAL